MDRLRLTNKFGKNHDLGGGIYISLQDKIMNCREFCSVCNKPITTGCVFGQTLLSNPEETLTQCLGCIQKVNKYFAHDLEELLSLGLKWNVPNQ